MTKRVYISADYAEKDGDRDVVEVLTRWGSDNLHKVDFVDMAQVVSGSVSQNPDCRACDLKSEFNRQINASSVVIFVIGKNTAIRKAGSKCSFENRSEFPCKCTPYKGNRNGVQYCKYTNAKPAVNDIGNINNFSYLEHEFQEAIFKNKRIIILYNSLSKKEDWLPAYMRDYVELAVPFWIKNKYNERVGNYEYIKQALETD